MLLSTIKIFIFYKTNRGYMIDQYIELFNFVDYLLSLLTESVEI